jgi:hypothetical protein
MKMFFPNGTILFPPTKGTDIHKYQITKNLVALGYKVTTFDGDQNPEAEHIPKRPLSIVRALRACDVTYVRTGEGVTNATRLTSPLFRQLIPDKVAVVWEMNLDFMLKVRRDPRTNEQVESDLRYLRKQARRVDAAICVTDAIAEKARGLLGINYTYTVQNGSDPDMFRPDLPKMATAWRLENGSVLNVAWIAAEANAIHDAALVLELAHRINERGLPIKIHAIGDTAGLFPMPVPSSVLIHGPVSYLDLPELLASMDVGLVLYNIKYDGGSPLKLFDYCSSGCVPICSPGQGIENCRRCRR